MSALDGIDTMILAAGLGTRMRPLTDTRPKPLVEVDGVTLLDRVIGLAKAEGARSFVINSHYQAHQIDAHVRELAAADPDCGYALSHEDELLGTGGGLKRALPLMKSDPVLVMNADAFWLAGTDAPLARLMARFRAGDCDVALLCAHPARAIGFRRSHDFCLAPDGHVTADRGTPVIYTGVMAIRRAAVSGESDTCFSLFRQIEAARLANRLYGVMLLTPWLHVGDVAAIAEAEAALGRAQ